MPSAEIVVQALVLPATPRNPLACPPPQVDFTNYDLAALNPF
jgi:hypothetical protein